MAKRKSQTKVSVAPARKRYVIIIGIVITMVVSGVMLAQNAKSKRSRPQAGAIAPTALTPSAPSKEYVYAGGRLVATEEPSAGGGGGGNGGGLVKLTGATFGTGPAFAPGSEYDKAFDNNTATFFDYVNANGGYTGIDLGAGGAKKVVKIKYHPRTNSSVGPPRMVGGKFQASNTGQTIGFIDLHTITSEPPYGWVEVNITDSTQYRYLRYLSPDGGYCNVAEIEFYTDSATSSKLTGTLFGTSPAFAPGSEYDKAHDGNTATFFDYIPENGGYTGLDLGAGNAKRITKVKYYARDNWASRMVGGKFQGSNTSSSSGYINLHTISVTPPQGSWVEVTITDATAYRYLRYLSPDGGYCNVADIEFYSESTASGNLLAGTKFGTGPAFAPGREYDKAFDGNTGSYFDYVNANGGYTGIDLGVGNAKAVIKIRYYPRTDSGLGPGRMVGGKLQGSNTSQTSGYVDLHTITTTPPFGWVEVTISDPTAYRYLRYLSPDGGYCNVAEIEFYGN